jgi:Flp pilus assembly protein TadD
VPQPKAPAIILGLLLAAGAHAPRAAHGHPNDPPADAAATTTVTETPAASAVVTDAAATPDTPAAATSASASAPAAPAPPRSEGNAFLRALAAPFRALAKLFGGGRKSSPDVAKQRETKRPEKRPAVADRDEQAQGAPAEPSQTAAAGPVRAAATTGPTAEGVRIVRPDEEPAAAVVPRTWRPFIEGVGKDPLAQGRALLEHGYLNEAIAELSVAAAGNRNLAEANNLLGLAYDRLGQHHEATEAYERALTVAPEDPVLLANLGYSRYLANDFDGALKRLRRAAKLAPRLNIVHNHLGIVQARLGKYGDAFRSFARATNEYDAHVRIASILDFERRERQAIKHYEAALRLQPDASAVLERLVSLYERTGDRIKADTARRTLGRPRNDQRTTTGGG